EDESEATSGASTRHVTSRRGRILYPSRLDMDDREDAPIAPYYEAGLEGGRLFSGSGPLELARTQDVLARHLPAPPARILDVGGGTGVYARWLASRGDEGHLVDPIERHVEEAPSTNPPPATARLGDA